MSDPASTARSARESLARGLAALQADPSVPPQILELAAPIAQSMGALHSIERSNGSQLLPHANVALENVRHALASLQQQPGSHPAIAAAMEAVASSLGLVHALSRLANPAAAAAPAAAPQQYQQPAPGAFNAPTHQNPAPQPQHYGQGAPQARPQAVAPMAQTVAAPQQFAPQAAGGFGAPPTAPMHAAPQAAPQQFVPQAAAPMHAAPQAAPAQPAGGYARDPFAPGAPAAGPAPAGDKLVVSADLGAQSPTNFYKGLSGNDIVDHGGLFVSTYMIPKIGTPIRLKVALPGGYEFEADAVVRWARDVRDASSDAPPGFGAQFTGITQEARQLVYRYVRNREPLFHDDL